ncbi:ABC transporter ATP-binding protein [Diaminobutyricimonas sp. LJ205]|uniref:ABC transporter ATP-binding protein n=1 Tax=Diaminobutyricimonas sp. LJ205 TaxID=2683590 RepID=UPI0012F4C424|nr:ABC transporter ATP-binding protein [Diaminobutyricimonas sp. LJ205]
MKQSSGLWRITGGQVTLVLSIAILQVGVLIGYVLLIRAIIDALVPGAVGAAADVVWRTAILQVIALAVLALFNGWLHAIEFSITERIGYRIVQDLRMRMYEHLQGMSARQFQGRARGGVLLRFLGDLSMTRMWVSRGVLGGFVAAIALGGATIGLGILNLWMTLAIVGVLLAGAAASLAAGHAMRRATRTMRRRRSLVMSNLDEQMNTLSIIQISGRTRGEYARLSRQNDTLTRALIRVARLRGYLRGIATASTMLAVAAVLISGLFEVRRGGTTVGTVVAFAIVVRQLAGPIRRLGLAHDYWHRAQVSQQKILEFLQSSSRELDNPIDVPLRVRKGTIEFDHVSVEGALSDVSFTIPGGQFVAITGPGGAGKSTLLGLVARTIDPNQGSIVIDGQPLEYTTLRSIARWIGAVGPDLPLTRGTVRRNLTYAMPDVSDDELQRVLAVTGVDDLLDDLPHGLETWVTEGGRNLSLSQRQRIALGRAIMGSPPILLLDEPTHGLDEKGRDRLLQMLSRHRGTVLLASHDPRELALADTVIVLTDGLVVAEVPGDEFRDRLWLAEEKGIDWQELVLETHGPELADQSAVGGVR